MIKTRTKEIEENLESYIQPLIGKKNLGREEAKDIFKYINNPEMRNYWDNYREIVSRLSMNYDSANDLLRLWEEISVEKTKLAIATRLQMKYKGNISSYEQAKASGEGMISRLKELNEVEKGFFE